MAVSKDYLDFLVEQMSGFGPVTARRMFGGAGLYRDGQIFALVIDDALYLKTDEAGRQDFKELGLGPFSYSTKTGEHTITSYWRAPEACFDDPDVMKEWCESAYAVALQPKPKKRTPKSKKLPS